jgi:NTP pyrophosphatase (non-canonical NTP hydrolase)
MCDDTPDRLALLMDDVRHFVQERAWERYHDPKNLVMAVASEAGELCDVLRWVPSDEADAAARGRHRGALEAEIADVAICLLMLCDRVGIDLVDAARAKLESNRIKYPVALSRGKAEPAAP